MVVGALYGPDVLVLDGAGSAHAVVWPGMGAELRSMHRISMPAGARTLALRHPGEAVYYVIEGGGEAVDRDAGTRESLIEGSMIHIDGGTAYELVAGDAGIELVGGPAPCDPALYPEPW
jgi:quercetin dioxygenase-like cupin family protein